MELPKLAVDILEQHQSLFERWDMKQSADQCNAAIQSIDASFTAAEAQLAELRIALDNHNSGSKQLAKWLEESRLEAMDAKRRAASDRARARMMRVDLAQLLEVHRSKGISSLFLALEEYLQNVIERDR